MVDSRSNITIDGVDYYVVPGTFVEGSVRRQAEFAYLGEEDLKSRPDTREFLQTSWLGGSQWEKPVLSSRNDNTYYFSNDVSLTDRGGAIQESEEWEESPDVLMSPSVKMVSWNGDVESFTDTIDGAVTFAYNGVDWTWYYAAKDQVAWVASTDVETGFDGDDDVFAMAAGDTAIFAYMSDGQVAWWNPLAGTHGRFASGQQPWNGASIWVDNDYVWLYDSSRIYRYSHTGTGKETIVDDDWGYDRLAWEGDFSMLAPCFPEWSMQRAISTSEGIFYVKNVNSGGSVDAYVYRVDKDASGSHILTPIGTLPEGAVAMEITHHLGSLLITTVPSFTAAASNNCDLRVTIYHVTGKSIGAIGSPLGGTNIDETPVWFLGSHNEQLRFGGRKRVWEYDARIGAFHNVHEVQDVDWINHGGGFSESAGIRVGSKQAQLYSHCAQKFETITPLYIQEIEGNWHTTAQDDALLISNHFDFDLPMETKTIHELYYDSEFIRDGAEIQFQVSADGGAWTTVYTITGGTSPETYRTPITPISGFKFQYRINFGTAPDITHAEPSRILAVGFGAFGGEQVPVIQVTIDGKESPNQNNTVQDPEDVYNSLSALRATHDTVVVSHTYRTMEYDTPVIGNYRVMSVTGRKDSPRDGLYEVQLVGVP